MENSIQLPNFTKYNSFTSFDEYLYSKLLKEKNDDIINELFQKGIPDSNGIIIKTNKGENLFILYNDM